MKLPIGCLRLVALVVVAFFAASCVSEGSSSSGSAETTAVAQPTPLEKPMDFRVAAAKAGEDAVVWDDAVVVDDGNGIRFSFTGGIAECFPVSRVVLTPEGPVVKAQLFVERQTAECVLPGVHREETVALPTPIPLDTNLIQD